MINPENLNLESLPWMPLEEKSAFPKQSAIYFAIDSLKNIQYIGRSCNVKARWAKHHKFEDLQAIGNIRIAYLFMDADLLPSIEMALIEWFRPPLNLKYDRKISKQGARKEGEMNVYVSIGKWYPKDAFGNYLSINSVFESIEGTQLEVGRHTLGLALDGEYRKGLVVNLVKLARLCSMWSGERVTVDDLLVVSDD